MLENLDAIDWSALGCADMPTWVRGFLSPYKSVADASWARISDNLVPTQAFDGGDPDYLLELAEREAVMQFIPILIELLDASEVNVDAKLYLLVLFRDIAGFIEVERFVRRSDLQRYLARAGQIIQALHEGVPVLQRLVQVTSLMEEAAFTLDYLNDMDKMLKELREQRQ